jgi:hypothetical protein
MRQPRQTFALSTMLSVVLALSLLTWLPGPRPGAASRLEEECLDWRANHPEWIFCDDFESDAPMKSPERYFEYGDDEGHFVPLDGLAFGRNPNGYMNSQQRNDEDFREVFYRMYLRMQAGWEGNPAKLSRATIFNHPSDWSQAMIAHLWSDGKGHLLVDPVRCVDGSDNVKCKKYNDFDNMDWLGNKSGITPVFETREAGRWLCVEAHVKLNDPGASNGVQEFWIDDGLEARREGMDFVRGYTEYGINAIFFENYWNDGSSKTQERYFDNIVVSQSRIGCLADASPEPTATSIVAPSATASPMPASTSTPEVPTEPAPEPKDDVYIPRILR